LKLHFKKNYLYLTLLLFAIELYIGFIIAWSVLIFAYAVEIAQYFNIVGLLGLSGNRSAEIIIGTSFSWEDMLAYTLGVALVYFLDEKMVPSRP